MKKLIIFIILLLIILSTTILYIGFQDTVSYRIHKINSIDNADEIVKEYDLKNKERRLKQLNMISNEKLEQNVKELSIDNGIRVAGSEEEENVATFILEILKMYGYYANKQTFQMHNGKESENIIAYKKDFELKKERSIVIGAHYDTVQGSPGAMDNSTGVSSALEIARVLSNYTLSCNIVYTFFGAEECEDYTCQNFHQGSYYYVSNLSKKEKSMIMGMINLDNIGDTTTVQIRRDENLSVEFTSRMKDAFTDRSISFEIKQSLNWSDHDSFENAHIPALFIYTPSKSFVHSPADTIDNISFKRLEDITQAVVWSLVQYYRCDN